MFNDEQPWLSLEKGVCRGLNLRHNAGIVDPDPNSAGRRSLILKAAHSIFLEAFVEDLPQYARTECGAGRSGLLRTTIANTDPTNRPLLQRLRDDLIESLTGESGRRGAIWLADQIHMRRLLWANVPVIVAVGCFVWYGSHRNESDLHATTATALWDLYREWQTSATQRPQIEAEMKMIVTDTIENDPGCLLDVDI